jgi:hypothetical protein
MPGIRLHFHRRALIPLLLGALSLGATAAAGLQPSEQRGLPDSAFVPVTVDAPPRPSVGGQSNDVLAQANDVAPIADPWLLADPPADRARPPVPAAQPIAVARTLGGGSHSISGRASWYCDAGVSPCSSSHPDTSGFDAYGAAGPRLRAAIGANWRGMVVTIDGVRVKLIDWCQCYKGEPSEKLIDLYHDVYLRTGSAITIRW